MAKIKDIDQVFLNTLHENGYYRDKINKEVLQFKDADWDKLFELATKHGLFSVFYTKLSGLELENVPPAFHARLKNAFLLNLKRNLLLEKELSSILAYFKDLDIPVIPIKGPLLARYLYGDLAARQASCDLDLLVRRESIKDAEYLFGKIGYDSRNEDETGFLRSIKLKYARQLHFTRKISGLGNLMLDLHWDLRGFFIDTHLEDFWRNSREVVLDGHKITMPSNVDLLFFLSLAALFPLEFVRLKYLYDMHTFISKFSKEFDWRQISIKAEAYGFQSFLFFSLKLSQVFFHTEIPKDFLNRLNPGFVKENILKILLNRENILHNRENVATSYSWRYLFSNYLFTDKNSDFFKKTYKKIFLPMKEVMGFYNRPQNEKSYSLYIKRLLKPVLTKFKITSLSN